MPIVSCLAQSQLPTPRGLRSCRVCERVLGGGLPRGHGALAGGSQQIGCLIYEFISGEFYVRRPSWICRI
jgi:hypothetical protein